MHSQQTTNADKPIINPEFKRQLQFLQKMAYEELNIQISVDKILSDESYRRTVLSELEGLGSDALNKLVTQLKHTPVYMPLASETPSATTKKSPLLMIAFSLLLIIAVALFVSWQNGHLNDDGIIDDAQSALTEQSNIALISTEESNVESVEEIEDTSAVAPLVPLNLSLPSEERRIKFRLHGSNTVGEDLAPALLEAFLTAEAVTKMHWLQGDTMLERELQYIKDDQVYAIQLHAHGSSTGFSAILNGHADMAMSSRKIKPQEVDALKVSKGDLTSSGQEFIVGLDGLAIIVHKENPISSITSEMLAKVFSGEISNWKQLGGVDLAINLYARDKNSGTWDTFNSLVLKPNSAQLASSSHRFESSNELSDNVAYDIAGIGFIGLPYVNNSKALAISETENSAVIYPTPFTVSTEDYTLSRRLYMYTPDRGNKLAREFAQFVISEKGQRIVEQVGLVSQNIKLETTYAVKNAPQIYNHYADIASRLSVSFRFISGTNEFDNKAKRDIKRLVDYLSQHRGRRIVLMGFSDSLGDAEMNQSLSLVRAIELEKELNAHGLYATAVEGLGAELPIASNKNAFGRSKNRRVEVWVF